MREKKTLLMCKDFMFFWLEQKVGHYRQVNRDLCFSHLFKCFERVRLLLAQNVYLDAEKLFLCPLRCFKAHIDRLFGKVN